MLPEGEPSSSQVRRKKVLLPRWERFCGAAVLEGQQLKNNPTNIWQEWIAFAPRHNVK